jgi:hypothetical protein
MDFILFFIHSPARRPSPQLAQAYLKTTDSIAKNVFRIVLTKQPGPLRSRAYGRASELVLCIYCARACQSGAIAPRRAVAKKGLMYCAGSYRVFTLTSNKFNSHLIDKQAFRTPSTPSLYRHAAIALARKPVHEAPEGNIPQKNRTIAGPRQIKSAEGQSF